MVSTFRRLLVVLVALFGQCTCLFAQEDDLARTQAPALQFVMALGSLVVIMLILCMPSRKRQGEKKT